METCEAQKSCSSCGDLMLLLVVHRVCEDVTKIDFLNLYYLLQVLTNILSVGKEV